MDLDGDSIDESFATNGTNGNIAKDDWLFSPPIILVSGTNYDISFKYNGFDSSPPSNADESLKVVFIDAASSSGTVLTNLFSQINILQIGTFARLETMATIQTINYTSTASGTFYLAFNTTSPKNSGFLLLFEYSVDQTLGLNDFEINNFQHFYDKDLDILTLKSSTLSFNNIEIFNLLGQQVLNKKLFQTDETINLSSLKDGIYITKVTIDDKVQTLKLLKN